jgi:hypothetical protein
LVDALRQHARNTNGLAEILELEAKMRVDSDAQLADARARSRAVRGRAR